MKPCNAVKILAVLALTACRAHAVESTATPQPPTTSSAQASVTTAWVMLAVLGGYFSTQVILHGFAALAAK